MPVGVDKPHEAELYHDAGSEHRWCLRAHDFLEHLPPALGRVDFELKLRAAAIVKTGTDGPREEKQRHRALQRSDAGGASHHAMPDGHGQPRGKQHEGYDLQRVLVVLHQDEIEACGRDPEDEDGEERSTNRRQGTHGAIVPQYTSASVAKE